MNENKITKTLDSNGSILVEAIKNIENDTMDFSTNFYNQTSGGDGQNIVNNIKELHDRHKDGQNVYHTNITSDISSLNQIKYIPTYPHFIIYKLE